MALSKNKIRAIASLSKKKERDESGLFLAEGEKIVSDLLPTFHCRTLVCTEAFHQKHPHATAEELILAEKEEISKASLLQSPPPALAVFEKPRHAIDKRRIAQQLTLALDTIQDPGNLGTILRVADWFGIEDIVCSMDTADLYNPKVVQATMGAIARVRVHYTDLERFLQENEETPIYGTFLDGENIYGQELTSNGIVVMGNEGKGISERMSKLIRRRLFIPSYPAERTTSESLNVAMATGIVCSEFRRRGL
jgi:rRNA methylases